MKKPKSLAQLVSIPLLAGGLALGVSGCVGPGGISPQGEAVLTGLFMTAATEDIKRSVNPNQTNVNVYNNKEGRWDNERKYVVSQEIIKDKNNSKGYEKKVFYFSDGSRLELYPNAAVKEFYPTGPVSVIETPYEEIVNGVRTFYFADGHTEEMGPDGSIKK